MNLDTHENTNVSTNENTNVSTNENTNVSTNENTTVGTNENTNISTNENSLVTLKPYKLAKLQKKQQKLEQKNPNPQKPKKFKIGAEVDETLRHVCRDFMRKSCTRDTCHFVHDAQLCPNYWKNGSCKFKHNCRKNHFVTFPPNENNNNNNRNSNSILSRSDLPRSNLLDNSPKRNKKKNTECFEPRKDPVDMRIIYDLDPQHISTSLTSRDVLLAPCVFSNFKSGELYQKLLDEIGACGVPEKDLFKLWHGNNVIPGTHLICNDRTPWKNTCPTFAMVIDQIQRYFSMDIQATRLNWYTDTSQWKPFHHDSAYVNPEKAVVQNFTVAVSFGATRDAAFEHASTKTVVSLPQPDGCVYAFANDTNAIWRHGILQDTPVRNEGRISVICWGKVDNLVTI